MSLHTCEVTNENWQDVAFLSVGDSQKDFIESNAFSLAQSKFEPEWKSFGLYDGETLVGYAMYGLEKSNDTVWLDRFMIDCEHQGKGYASRFLRLLLQDITAEYKSDKVYLSIADGNDVAQRLYEKFGFALNGKIDDAGEFPCYIMELDVKRSLCA